MASLRVEERIQIGSRTTENRQAMKKQAEILARGVYVAPWMDPATRRPVIVLIDRFGCCTHGMTHQEGETEEEALARAQAMLDLLDA
jgi:hypothetical protein